jgi:hypothetical protein
MPNRNKTGSIARVIEKKKLVFCPEAWNIPELVEQP